MVLNITNCDDCGKTSEFFRRFNGTHWINKQGIQTYRCRECSTKYALVVKNRKEKQKNTEKKKQEKLRKLISDSVVRLF